MGIKDKRIFWLTAGYFLDVDLPVVPLLKKRFDIDWMILTSAGNLADDERYIRSKTDCSFEILADTGNFYSLEHYRLLRDTIKRISKEPYSLYYFDISDFLFLFPLINRYLPKERVVIATHNVSVPKGARLALLAKCTMRYVLSHFKNFQVFSSNQRDVILRRRPDADILYAPLMLKDYGDPAQPVTRDGKEVRFLFFGNIVRYKRLDILIEAVDILKKKGIEDFKIYICGYCQKSIWDKEYAPKIADSSLYHLDIRRIPNDEVARYFAECDYFVMPYQDIAQSGAMTVALNYNMPIIASDLPTFHEFITGAGDSMFFRTGDASDLATKMEEAIRLSEEDYELMKSKLKRIVDEKLSERAIISKYESYISRLLNSEE